MKQMRSFNQLVYYIPVKTAGMDFYFIFFKRKKLCVFAMSVYLRLMFFMNVLISTTWLTSFFLPGDVIDVCVSGRVGVLCPLNCVPFACLSSDH